jgi:hypothetical protein
VDSKCADAHRAGVHAAWIGLVQCDVHTEGGRLKTVGGV